MFLDHAPDDAQHAWQVLHPPVQAWDSGWLDVGDGHCIWWEQCGHPGAPTALFVHGGPAAGCTAQDRRWFNPQHWRTVLYDQRGCGRSRPLGSLRANHTAAHVADIERLRQHLGVERWLLFGGSWGSTLALAYALAHPQRVSALVLRGVFLGTQAETEWLYGCQGAARRHPAAWARLCRAAGVGENVASTALLHAFGQRLQADDAAAVAAARAWLRWESDLMDAETTAPSCAVSLPDDQTVLTAARISLHHACAGWFLAEGPLLHRLALAKGIPCHIVQGSRDLVTPPGAARALHAAWPGSVLTEVATAGHASSHPALARQLINAVAAFATVQHTHSKPEMHHA